MEQQAGSARHYDAFISYSHASDTESARSIQKGLQRLAKPLLKRRALEVFRDETSLIASSELGPELRRALDDSRHLVLLCSPTSAQSVYVEDEIKHWLQSNTPDTITMVLTDGVVEWDDATRNFRFDVEGNAVSPALSGVFVEEPLYVDMTWAREQSTYSMRNATFRSQVASIAAPIHGVRKEAIESADTRVQRRIRIGIAVVMVLLVGLLANAVRLQRVANQEREAAQEERDRADLQAREAMSRRLASLSSSITGADSSLPFLLAAEAYNKAPTLEAQGALAARQLRGTQSWEESTSAANDSNHLRLVGHDDGNGNPGVIDLAVSPDGLLVATLDAAMKLRIFDTQDIGDPVTVDDEGIALTFVDDTTVALATNRGVLFVGVDGQTSLVELDDHVVAVGAGHTPGAAIAALGSSSDVVLLTSEGVTARFNEERVPDSVSFVGAVGDDLVLTSSGLGGPPSNRVYDQAGAMVSSWHGPAVHDINAARTHAIASFDPGGMGGPVPFSEVRDISTGEVAWGSEVFEYYKAKTAAFIGQDDTAVVGTYGGVDGAPSQLFRVAEDDTDVARMGQVEQLPAELSLVAARAGTIATGGRDPVVFVSVDPVERAQLSSGSEGHRFGADINLGGLAMRTPMSVSKSGRMVATNGTNISIVSVQDGAVIPIDEPVSDGEISPDGRHLLAADGVLFVDEDGVFTRVSNVPIGDLGAVAAWSADGTAVAYLADENETVADTSMPVANPLHRVALVRLVDGGSSIVTSERQLCAYGCLRHMITLALSDDASRLVIGGPGGSHINDLDRIDLYDTESGNLLDSIEGTTFVSVSFDAEASEFLIASGNSLIRTGLDDLTSQGTRVIDPIAGWSIAPGGERVATFYCDITLLNSESWTADTRFVGHQMYGEEGCDTTADAAWLEGGTTLITYLPCADRGGIGSEECAPKQWDLDPERLHDAACVAAGRNMTRSEWEQFLPGWDYQITCDRFSGEAGTTASDEGGDGRQGEPGRDDTPTSESSVLSEPDDSTTTAQATTDPPSVPDAVEGSAGGSDTVGADGLTDAQRAGLVVVLSVDGYNYVGRCDEVDLDTYVWDGLQICLLTAEPAEDEIVHVTVGEPFSDVIWDFPLGKLPDGSWDVLTAG